jgi:hypothetical protein
MLEPEYLNREFKSHRPDHFNPLSVNRCTLLQGKENKRDQTGGNGGDGEEPNPTVIP